jgi:ABC-type uncharacterized transport system substrate-binding protein
MKRREFLTVLGGTALWPLSARAQQGNRVRRIGVLTPYDENDPLVKPGISAFTRALAGLGWTDGRNVRIDLRWGGGDINRIRALAQELVGLQPDIILANTTLATAALQRETRLAAARNNVPAVYWGSEFARDGGLLSYGPDRVDIFRRAASYVDRILRGEKPGDLPVQFPTKFEMIVNRKTATALGLAVPPSIMLRADEVIE